MRAEASIDLGAIADNLKIVNQAVASTPVMGIVKADAYGHGMVPVSRLMRAAGATWLGVALPAEARALRESGDRGPLLAWLWSPGDEHLVSCIASRVDLSVSSTWAVAEVEEAARRAGVPAHVHLKVDTGLSRNGAPMPQWADLVDQARRAQERGRLQVVGLWSHLACADEPGHPSIDRQRAAFQQACEQVASAGIDVRWRHVANSAAALTRPDLHYDLVRVGIAAYGVSPFPPRPASEWGLRPAMTVRARIALVKEISAGASVSYGGTWSASKATRIALVPVGYADGIPRIAGNRSEVSVKGHRCPMVGRVAMDQFVIDVGEAEVEAGDEVAIIGGDGPSADELAAATDTIGYEIVTRIGPRIPRRYQDAP